MLWWTSNVVLPNLFPKHIHSKIKIIICDDDPQEYLQIDNSSRAYLHSLSRGWYVWHILNKGFENNVEMKFPDVAGHIIQEQITIILFWLISWKKELL